MIPDPVTRFADLSKADQAAVRAQLRGGKVSKPKPSRREGGSPTPYRCSCGEMFADFPAAERCSRGHGGGRLEAYTLS